MLDDDPQDPTAATAPGVSVVVLAFGSEPWLVECIDAILASRGVHAEIVLVDNGCSNAELEALSLRPGVTLARPAHNLGFAGGCNFGAARATRPTIALVNSDAIVEPDALARLAAVSSEPDVGIATCSLRLASDRQTINSVGNPVHVSCLTWAGSYGQPAAAHALRTDVTTASGAAMTIGRDLWNSLGGFAPEYFAYLEDTELSLRCWQHGRRVVYVPDAVVLHHYEFSRSSRKYELLERNRLFLLLTLFEGRTLALLAPVLALMEVALLAMAAAQGWLPSKLRAYRQVLRQRRWVRERRRLLQSQRTVADDSIIPLLTTRLDPANVAVPAATRVLDTAVSAWMRLVRGALLRER